MKVQTREDVEKVIRRSKRGSVNSLKSAGAFTRTTMKRTIGKTKKPRPEGKPMSSGTGRARGAVLFAVEGKAERVLVGPTRRRAGKWAAAHEHGGKYKKSFDPARPFAAPTIPKVAPKLARFWRGTLG